MDDVDSDETLINRQTRLRQLICGRDVVDEQQDIPVGFNELLDALFVLYNECSKDSFKRNKYASGFVKKCEYFGFYKSTVICTVRVFVCTVSNHIHCDMYRARIRVHGI